MNIKWYGQTCFRISTQKNKNGVVNILIDPFLKESGFHSPKLEADILLSSSGFENRKKELPLIKGSNFVITGPGEYDIKGVYIQGISAETKAKGEKTVIYTIKSEEIKICHLGRLGKEELSSDQVEKIGEIDILMIPIGGNEVINAKEAVKVMAQIEPKITIPMYYRTPKIKVKLNGLDEFLKGLGVKSLQSLPRLSIKKKDISKDEAKIIVLEA